MPVLNNISVITQQEKGCTAPNEQCHISTLITISILHAGPCPICHVLKRFENWEQFMSFSTEFQLYTWLSELHVRKKNTLSK